MSSLMDTARAAAARPTYKELRAEIEGLRTLLEPFAAAVYNDNGDVTYTTGHIKTDDYWRAYLALRPVHQQSQNTEKP